MDNGCTQAPFPHLHSAARVHPLHLSANGGAHAIFAKKQLKQGEVLRGQVLSVGGWGGRGDGGDGGGVCTKVCIMIVTVSALTGHGPNVQNLMVQMSTSTHMNKTSPALLTRRLETALTCVLAPTRLCTTDRRPLATTAASPGLRTRASLREGTV